MVFPLPLQAYSKIYQKSFIVPKNAEEGTFWVFSLSSWAQKIKIPKEGTSKHLSRHQKVSEKKSPNAEKNSKAQPPELYSKEIGIN